jgi:adenylosuccinate lyase
MATEIRNLQRTDIREAEEYFAPGQKGSSAMPHKRNPITCEKVSGMARLLRGNALAAMENVALWHERDISHSSAERGIFPDSTIALDYLLDRMTFIIRNLHVYPENVMDNINRTGGLFYSQSLLLKLIEKGLTREDSYRIVQDAALRVWKKEGSLRELMEKDPQAAPRITKEEMDSIFDLQRYLKNIGAIYKKLGIDY